MKNFYLCIVVVLVITILAVALIPAVSDFVERVFFQYLGRAAR